MALLIATGAPRSMVADCGNPDADHRVVTSPSFTRPTSFPDCWAVATAGRPVDAAGISAASWLPASRRAPTQNGGESLLTVPEEVADGGVCGAGAVYGVPGAAAVAWQS